MGRAALKLAAFLPANPRDESSRRLAISVSLAALATPKVLEKTGLPREGVEVSGIVETATREKPPTRPRGGSHARASDEFSPSTDLLIFLCLISILITLLYFRDDAVEISSQFGGMLFSWVFGIPSDFMQPIPEVFSFPELSQAMAILGSVVLTAFSTIRLHGETRKLFLKTSFFDDVVGTGLFGGFLTFFLLRKHVLLVITAIGTVVILGTFGATFASGGATPEQVLLYAVGAALPFVFMTTPLLVILTLVSSTLSNTMAGIYYYASFNRKRKRLST